MMLQLVSEKSNQGQQLRCGTNNRRPAGGGGAGDIGHEGASGHAGADGAGIAAWLTSPSGSLSRGEGESDDSFFTQCLKHVQQWFSHLSSAKAKCHHG